jgi:hypothetical protein
MAEETEQVVADEEVGTDLELVNSDKLAEVIAGMTEIDSNADAMQTRYRIVAEMLAAETEEDLWRELPTWSSKSSVGEQFEIGEIRGIFRSRYPDVDTGLAGGFLACSATKLASGEVGIFTTSALRIAGKLGWYHQHGKLPVKVEVVQRGENASGFPILDVDKIS